MDSTIEDQSPPAPDDATAVAIRSAYRDGKAKAQADADHVLALRLAEARLDSAIDAIDVAIAALVKCPASYTTDDGKGNDAYGEGRSIHAALRRERDALARRRTDVTAALYPRRSS